MVVPSLGCHLDGNEETSNADNSCHSGSKFFTIHFYLFPYQVEECCNTHTTPNGEGIERTGIGIVTLTRLHGGLIQIDDNGKTGHKEQEEDYPELADANGFDLCLFLAIDSDAVLTGVP